MASSPESSGGGKVTFTDQQKKQARTFFQRAREVAAGRNYDYAIDMFIEGLGHWPEAVEEGHQQLRLVAMQRRAAGGKKPGMMEAMKRPTVGKDALKSMLNAEYLLAKDPDNLGYMESLLKSAMKLRYEDTIMWVVGFQFDQVLEERKVNPAQYRLIRDALIQVSEQAEERGDPEAAIAAMQRAHNVMERLADRMPQDMGIANELRELSGKLTITKGKYGTSEDFRGSLRDSSGQAELRDADRLIQSSDRLGQLIEGAKKKYAAAPDDMAAVTALVDLLTKEENEQRENEAIGVLLESYQRSSNYRYKMRADDIRIRQLARQDRELAAGGDKDARLEHRRKMLGYELAVWKERTEKYPTELKIKYEYGKRLFAVRKFDEAIPLLQEAKADPKARAQCGIMIGRCFLEKGYLAPAIDTFRAEIAAYELKGDDISKQQYYWLGRALEEEGQSAEAMKTYGQLIQWDFNYRDTRNRMDELRKK